MLLVAIKTTQTIQPIALPPAPKRRHNVTAYRPLLARDFVRVAAFVLQIEYTRTRTHTLASVEVHGSTALHPCAFLD